MGNSLEDVQQQVVTVLANFAMSCEEMPALKYGISLLNTTKGHKAKDFDDAKQQMVLMFGQAMTELITLANEEPPTTCMEEREIRVLLLVADTKRDSPINPTQVKQNGKQL